jgi:hypothetical protein
MARLPITGDYPADWPEIATAVKADAGWRCVRCDHHDDVTTGHVLTVHHFDGHKANCDRYNLMALCQRCHLSIQARVDPRVPILFVDVALWSMPYIAGVIAAGHCVEPPGYDLETWVERYEAPADQWPAHWIGDPWPGKPWPTWAPTPQPSPPRSAA